MNIRNKRVRTEAKPVIKEESLEESLEEVKEITPKTVRKSRKKKLFGNS